jgi:ABC-type transporter Mla MlaB component
MDAWSTLRRPVRELRPGDHAWLAYRGADEHEHIAGAFVRGGLTAGHGVVCVTDGRPGAVPGVGLDVKVHEGGRLRLVPRAEACLAEGGFDPKRLYGRLRREIRAARAAGGEQVWVTLDLSWAADRFEELVEWEQLLDEVVRDGENVLGMCQFDLRACTVEEATALAGHHSVLATADPDFDDSVLRITRTFQPYGLRVEGEIDAARHAALSAALRALGDRAEEVHLDLAGLRFIDLGGLSLVADHAVRHGRHRTLVLDHVPGQLRMVMEIVGWQRLPGLRLGEPNAEPERVSRMGQW